MPTDREDRETAPVRLGVDVGGTFTDVALVAGDDLTTAKVPTTTPQHDGVLDGIREACEAAGIDPAAVDAFAHATTASVNALLERDGARTALVTTAGFRDVLEIGRQTRPSLYDLGAQKADPLVPRRRRFEVDERATTDGTERPVDPEAVREIAADVAEADAESVAVSLLHAYANPENEARVADVLREALDVPVSASHDVLAEFREFERTGTTVADAYLTPELDAYLGRVIAGARNLGLPEPRVMRSNGGVADAETVRESAVTTVLSGPAAGVVGAAAVASDAVTFDMGGTSSDVSLVRDGRVERTAETTIADVPLRTPTVDVETVGAGGGSIAWTDAGGALRVGPESAGADPGPACYGKGGTEATVTDADVLLGYIGADAALGGDLSLDVDAARDALDRLADAAGIVGGDDGPDGAGLDAATAAARGVFRVANATMARAIRSVTVERGRDPRAFDLVAFGGAGPMHAAALADRLGMDRVLVPGPAGVLSAYGLLAADETHDAARTVRLSLADASAGDLESAFEELTERVLGDVSDPDAASVERAADCRYAGQSFELTVDAGIGGDGSTESGSADPEALAERFAAAHERTYGYRLDAAVEAVTLRGTATVDVEAPSVSRSGGADATRGTREVVFPETGAVDATVYDRDALGPGATPDGPAVLAGTESTTVVPPDWRGRVRRDGTVVLERAAGGERR
ncbi:5-oxoprolinase (ATP-hydrolyzing) [Halorubrum aidingense JCM 13560]|uniref:5-oxoprolinase (ATP-hydrolyzing) n=1 Tax=Halorubrum aidingense JCM 13560 TaxID=1230454 RepID=M0P598_9EURY|nr:hydantoinase/oxoprolinase family protein [Halorubrum aidingense]EMA65337.1 5-oxoprolinase (ATP-hydrolyzing) [Halorubrum aidingense JCM 13560]